MVGVGLITALTAAQAPPPRSNRAMYEGTVSIVELDGRNATEPDGRIVLGLWPGVANDPESSKWTKGSGPAAVAAEVTRGHFRFDSVPNSVFFVQRLELGGRVAHVPGNPPFAPNPASPWRIEADRNSIRSVAVVDEESGSALDRIEACVADDIFHRDPPVRSDQPGVVLSCATSPIELAALDADPSRDRETRYWIRAAHHEWRRMTLDLGAAPPPAVRLAAAATLVVELDREISAAGACIELYDEKPFDAAGDGWIDCIATKAAQVRESRPCSGSKRVEFDPLPPGDYAAVVVVQDFGNPFRPASAFGFGRVAVPAKSAAKLAIAVSEPMRQGDVEFAGTLQFDPAWQEELPTLHLWSFQGVDDGADGRPRPHIVRAADYRPVEGSPNTYRWTFGAVPLALWILRVDGWSQFNDVNLADKFVAHRDLSIGPPVETLVQIVDDRTGEPAPLDELHFGVGEHTGICPRAATPAARRGDFLLRSPAGPIELMTWQRDYWGFEASLAIAEDMPKVVLRARRVGGVHLHLTVDGKPLRPDGFSARLVGVGDTKVGAPQPSFSSAEGNVLLVVEEVGRYRLEVTAGTGMAAVPSREFELRPGFFEDLNLELSPTR